MIKKMRHWLSPDSPFASVLYLQKGDDPVLDGLRGISILLIILFHSFYGAAYVLRDAERIEEFLNAVPGVLAFVFTSEKAVDIFFLVSGFLLGKSLLAEWVRNGRIHVQKFYVRRLFRIVPLFYLALIIYSPINVSRSLKNLWVNLLFIDNYWGKMIIPVGWSLSIEMQFYLILPFLIAFLVKRSRPLLWLMSGVGVAYGIQAIVCLLVPEIYQTPFSGFITKQVNPDIFMVNYYYPTQVRFGPLLMGVTWGWLSFRSDQGEGGLQRTSTLWPWVIGCISLGFIGIGSYFPSYQSESYFNQHLSENMNFRAMVLHRNTYALGWLGVLVVVHVMQHGGAVWAMIRKLLSFRLWRPFSQCVFPMFLFHFPMIIIAGYLVIQKDANNQVAMLSLGEVFLIFLISSVLSLILGMLLHFTIELPMIRRGKALAKRMN